MRTALPRSLTLMQLQRTLGLAALTSLSFLLIAHPARAADEEIQVYMDDMSQAGHFGLDVHANYVVDGHGAPGYAGEQSPLHRLRLTPEFAYGLTDNIELGMYLPLADVDSQGRLSADGVKFRIKYITPKKPDQTWFSGLNLEVGRVGHKLDANPYNGELKGILGKSCGPWTVAVNLNLDFKISGPESAPTTLEIATRITRKIGRNLTLGLENYNGMGPVNSLGHFAANDQAAYLVADSTIGKWDLELGIGTGYGANRDHTILKAIIGVPFD